MVLCNMVCFGVCLGCRMNVRIFIFPSKFVKNIKGSRCPSPTSTPHDGRSNPQPSLCVHPRNIRSSAPTSTPLSVRPLPHVRIWIHSRDASFSPPFPIHRDIRFPAPIPTHGDGLALQQVHTSIYASRHRLWHAPTSTHPGVLLPPHPHIKHPYVCVRLSNQLS